MQYKRLISESIWIALGQALAILGSVLGIRVLTGLIDPKTYGEVTLALTISTLVSQLITGPLSNGITRYYAPCKEKGKIHLFKRVVQKLQIEASLGIIVLFLLTIFVFIILKKTNIIILLFAGFSLSILEGNNSILSGVQNAARQRTIVALHQGIASWLKFLLAAGLIYMFGSTSLNTVIGYILGIGFVYISQSYFFHRVIDNNITNEAHIDHNYYILRKDILTFSWPFAIWGLFTWAQLVSDRWALNFFYSTEEVGLYAVLFQLGYYPISLVTNMMVQLIAPIYYQAAGDATNKGRIQKVEKSSWQLSIFVIILTSVAFILGYFFHNEIFRIFVGAKFSSISYLLPWFLLSGGIFAAGQTLTLNFQSNMKTHLLIFPKISTAIAGIILNFIFAYFFGIPGVVMSSVIFSFIYFSWVYILNKNRRQLSLS